VDQGNGSDFPSDQSGDFRNTDWFQGASAAARWDLWERSDATEYRGTAYDDNSEVALDVKSVDSQDTANTFFCAASGCSANPTNGYGNEFMGEVTSLITRTNRGIGFTTGQNYQLYQLGSYGCDCWESVHLDTNPHNPATAAPIIFGDNDYRSVGYTGPYSIFWIR